MEIFSFCLRYERQEILKNVPRDQTFIRDIRQMHRMFVSDVRIGQLVRYKGKMLKHPGRRSTDVSINDTNDTEPISKNATRQGFFMSTR